MTAKVLTKLIEFFTKSNQVSVSGVVDFFEFVQSDDGSERLNEDEIYGVGDGGFDEIRINFG